MSLSYIKAIDQALYPNLIKELTQIYRTIHTGSGNHFSYKCLNSSLFGAGNTWDRPLPHEWMEWADKQLVPYEDQIEDRRKVLAYLVRASNRLDHGENLFALVPESMFPDNMTTGYLMHCVKYDEAALVELKQMPEYQLIQQQAVFTKMGI